LEDSSIDPNDRKILRELAHKCADISCLPETHEKAAAWTAHNKCEGYRPMVVAELRNWSGLGLPLRCGGAAAQFYEAQLQSYIVSHELIGDDVVTPPYVQVPVIINILPFGTKKNLVRAKEGPGYRVIPIINEITHDCLDTLLETTFSYDAEGTGKRADWVTEAIGDILPVMLVNQANPWIFTPTHWIVDYMTMEKMYFAMVDEPDAFHRLMQTIERDMIAFLRWQEENHLLFLNNGNDFIASGGYGFSDELPKRQITGGRVLSTDIWGHLNSQESIGISPAMYAEFISPYYKRIAEQFGLLYYGCCEPVNRFWDSICKYPNLRKLSISPWCDEAVAGELLAGSNIIYSRKPLPDFITGQKDFLSDAYRDYIKKTARLTRNCKVEYILLDTYIMNSNPHKIKQAVDIVRRYSAYD